MPNLVPGKRRATASAITCEVECLKISRPSGEFGNIGSMEQLEVIILERSRGIPSTLAARAVFVSVLSALENI